MKTGLQICAIALLALCSGCQNGTVPFTERPLEGLQKAGSQNGYGNTRPIADQEIRPQIYVRKPGLSVGENAASETGSLFDGDDKRNFLIVPIDPLAVGSFVDIFVIYARSESLDASKPNPQPQPGASAVPEPIPGLNEEEKKILAGLPTIDPPEAKNVPLRVFKMQVVGRRPNGDYDLRFQRELINSEESYSLLITAILPHEKAINPDPKRTLDLTSVEWMETKDGKVESKVSPGWDDEYSFRMSGFSELRSKEAVALEEKRLQLENSRKLIETQLRQLGAERNNVVQTRATVAKEKQENDQAVSKLEKEIEDKNKTIADQRDEIESLKADKPGAQKDAAGGK